MLAKHWTTKELLEADLTERGINRRLNEGTLYRLCRGIYTEERPDPESALRALQHRHRGIIFTGVTAAGVYGLMPISAPAFGNLRRGSIAVHNDVLHASPSRKRGRRRVNGIDVDTPIAVAAAIRATHDFWDLVKFLEQSYAGLRGEETFSRDINQLTPTEKADLAPLLERTVIGASSRLERMFINDLRRRGLDPIPNFKLGPYHWDLGFPCGTTVVDLDSRIFHTAGPDNPVDNAFIIDRWKTNYAIEKGWTGLRYTDVCIREIPPSVIAQIEHTLAHRRNTPGLKKNPRHVPEMQRKAMWEFHPELFN